MKLSARIRRMPKRRQKIALKRLLTSRLMCMAGKPVSSATLEEVQQIVFATLGIVPFESEASA
ncbi:hypothetical protein [Herbaspirillum aquaticum]|uniref:hypothetical protein n=1 Tax=Herbaspirillum aquaticum TaxID=568783 RepID=UPI0024DE5618|nr:hypothetical protein [Herbaspirillum aquaticum]